MRINSAVGPSRQAPSASVCRYTLSCYIGSCVGDFLAKTRCTALSPCFRRDDGRVIVACVLSVDACQAVAYLEFGDQVAGAGGFVFEFLAQVGHVHAHVMRAVGVAGAPDVEQ